MDGRPCNATASGDSRELLARVTAGTTVLFDSCLEHALLPNLGRGKTEALLSLRSTGARKAQHWLFVEEGGALPLDCRLWPNARLRVAPTYKHLGGLLHHQGRLHKEVKARAAMAWSAFNQRKKHVFASPKIGWSDKMVLFDALVSTVLFYGAGTWPSPDETCKQSLRGALRGMACQMLRPLYSVTEAWHLGSDWVFALLAMPTVDTYLHVHRLRYLLSCISLETREIWALAHWEQHWLAAAAGSVEWLWLHTDRGQTHASWNVAWTFWRAEARTSPGKWKARLRLAQRNAVAQERWEATVQRHQGLLFRQLRQAGASLPLDLLPAQPTRECCAVCGKQFHDLRAWAVHAFSTHGRVDESRTIVAGTQCPVCLKHYSSNVKLSRHVRYSRQRYLPEPGMRSRKGPDDSLHLGPPLQALGPVPAQREIQLDEEKDRPSAEVLDCLAHVTYDQTAESLPTHAVWSRLRLAFSCVCLPVSRLRETAHCWRSRLVSDGTTTGCPPDGRLLEAADWICQADLADWLVSEPGADQKAGDTFRLVDLHLSLLECRSVAFLPRHVCLTMSLRF